MGGSFIFEFLDWGLDIDLLFELEGIVKRPVPGDFTLVRRRLGVVSKRWAGVMMVLLFPLPFLLVLGFFCLPVCDFETEESIDIWLNAVRDFLMV